jgi:imidazolonepropionase-like amidohydrolase
VGSDSGTPANFHTQATWREVQLLVEHGMTPLEAIRAATKFPAMVMRKGNELGTIEPGKLADIILVRGSVLENINNLQNVAHVIKDGTIYK